MRRLSGGGPRIPMTPDVGLENDTPNEYEIHQAYSTVRNGEADRIAIQPGEVAVLLRRGSPHDFAEWAIYAPGEYPYAGAMKLSHYNI